MKLGPALGLLKRGGSSTPQIITATLTPATSVLASGQALDETTGWATFINPTNYASTAGTISGVVVDYIGTTPDATTELWGGETNHFSITVTDSAANERTFTTTLRTVAVTELVMTFQGTGLTIPMQNAGVYSGAVRVDSDAPTTFSAFNDAAFTISGLADALHTVRIRGRIGRELFNTLPTQAAKLRAITNLGNMQRVAMGSSYYAAALTSVNVGTSDVGAVADKFAVFSLNTSMTTANLEGFVGAATTNVQNTFAGNTNLATVTGLDTWDTSGVIRMDECFFNCPALDVSTLDVSGFNLESLSATGGMFNFISNGKSIPATIMDAAYLNWAGQTITPGVFIGLKQSVYTTGGAVEAARATIINSGVNVEDFGNAAPEVASAPTTSLITSTSVTVTLPTDPFCNGLQITNRAIQYIDITNAGSWTTFGSSYTEGQAVEVTGLTAETEYQFRGVYTNPVADNGGGGATNGTASVGVTTSAALDFSVEDSGEEPVITYDTGGVFSFTFDGDTYTTDYLGTTLNTSAFGAGPDYTPICFVQSAITEAGTSEGDTFTGIPAQFLYIGADPGDATYDWLEDGVSTGNGTTSYVVPGASVGVDVVFRTVYDGVTVDSDSVTITAAGGGIGTWAVGSTFTIAA